MLQELVRIDKNAAERPISLPDHPYVAALKDFGLDEVVAGIIDAFATTTVNAVLPAHLKQYILPLTGPVLEKVGFFPIHLRKAWKIYKTTPKARRKSLGYYFRDAMQHGTGNLVKDVVFHDPIYIGLMSLGLSQAPQIPPGVLSFMSYVIGVLAVAGIDVVKDEVRHSRYKKMLRKSGFVEENFYESRFCVLNERDPQSVVEGMAREFNLSPSNTVKYSDNYFDCKVPSYSGRTAKFRLRKRQRRESEADNSLFGANPDWVNSVQVVFTRAGEQKKGIDQCRYFPVKKEKLYALMPESADQPSGIADSELRNLAMGMQDGNQHSITFERTIANNNELAVCTDKISRERPFYILELKVFNDTKLLQQAMRYLMVECPIAVMQTTHGKSELLNGS